MLLKLCRVRGTHQQDLFERGLVPTYPRGSTYATFLRMVAYMDPQGIVLNAVCVLVRCTVTWQPNAGAAVESTYRIMGLSLSILVAP